MTHTHNALDEVGQLSMAEVDALPTFQIAAFLTRVAEIRETARAYESALNAALDRRFSEHAYQLRQQAGKTTGTVRFEADGYVIVADLPKRPEYDQIILMAAVEALRRWGENPEDYVGIEIKVAESKYSAWPSTIRQLFEPARTVRVGKPTYKLELIQPGAASPAANDDRFGGVQ